MVSVPLGQSNQGADSFPMFTVGLVVDNEAGRQVSRNDVFLDRIDYGVDGETIAVGMGRYQPKCARDCLFIFVGKFEPTDCESLPVSSDFGANPQIDRRSVV